MNTENFQVLNGWLRRSKEKNNTSFKTVSGESKSVILEMVNMWSETSLPTLLSNYDIKDIYNTNEFFYQCIPNKTYQLKSEKSYWGKLSKIGITGMARANAMGNKLSMLVIGKGPRIHDASKCQVFRLALQKSTKSLDGWETV